MPRHAAFPLVLAGLIGAAGPAFAGEAGYLEGDHATGEWGGARGSAAERGIVVGLVYTADLGRTSRDQDELADLEVSDRAPLSYEGLIDAWVDVDGGRAGLWRSSRFVVGVQHMHGYGRDGRLEPYQTTSNIDALGFTQLGECFFEQRFAQGRGWLRIGKQDSNRDLGSPRYPGNFVNVAYGNVPTVPMPSYPTPGLGIAGGVPLVGPLRVLGGAYEGRPEAGGFGFTTAFERERGVFGYGAIELLFGDGGGRPISRQTLGVWHHTADERRATPGAALPANQGAFLFIDQRLYSGESGTGGTHAFVRGALTRATAGEAFAYAGGGLTYHGLGSRSDDTVGCGLSSVWLESGLASGTAETMVELFYKARLTRFFSLQPDLQIYHQPQGHDGYGWAGTLRMRVKL